MDAFLLDPLSGITLPVLPLEGHGMPLIGSVTVPSPASIGVAPRTWDFLMGGKLYVVG